MAPETQETYYDLHLTGIGYLNRAREIPVRQGKALLAVDITALQGRADRLRKTRFDCKVVGKDAQALVRRLMPQIALGKAVLVGFRLGDLTPETFVYRKGERQGQTGISLRANLLKIAWVKIDGRSVKLSNSFSQHQRPRTEGVTA